jgi:hypothetical protein
MREDITTVGAMSIVHSGRNSNTPMLPEENDLTQVPTMLKSQIMIQRL